MKKTPQKTKLRLDREAVRTLQTHELHQVDGGNAPKRDWTGDSKNECCA